MKYLFLKRNGSLVGPLKKVCQIPIIVLLLFAFKVSANDKEAPPDLYIQLPTLLISVIQTREIKIIYKLILFIELFDPKKGQDIVFLMPKIVHAVRTDLYGLLGIVWHPSFRMNVSDLKTRLLTTIEKVVGKNYVKDVLIQELQSQLIK